MVQRSPPGAVLGHDRLFFNLALALGWSTAVIVTVVARLARDRHRGRVRRAALSGRRK